MNPSVSKKLSVPFISRLNERAPQERVTALKQHGALAEISTVNWLEFPYSPVAAVWVAWSQTDLWLHYEIRGDYYRCQADRDQGHVWEDCCAEFFCSVATEEALPAQREQIVYRNFEFNACGICLSALGTKKQRKFLDGSVMERIGRYPSMNPERQPKEGDPFDWKLTVSIPLDLLGFNGGDTFRANFYKCGDKTAMPHFLSWSPVGSREPDFHLPQWFGTVELLKA
ncbi:MAG: hypothetical protein LWW85_10005 [Marinilabiliales bacterium]|nr:hypothetical protein [Marinilabiliales bacterium]